MDPTTSELGLVSVWRSAAPRSMVVVRSAMLYVLRLVFGVRLAGAFVAGFGFPFAAGSSFPFAAGFSFPFAARFSFPFAAGFSFPFAAGFTSPFAARFSFPFAAGFAFALQLDAALGVGSVFLTAFVVALRGTRRR